MALDQKLIRFLFMKPNKHLGVRNNMIHVPDVLRGPPEIVESFISQIANVQQQLQQVVLDFGAVTWIYPFGAATLLEACRYLSEFSGNSVRIESMRKDVHAYLRRIDFFERAREVAYTTDLFDDIDEWGRNPVSANVLELVHIGEHADVYDVGKRARQILQYWFDGNLHSIDQIVSLLAESCSNVVDHSNDVGAVTIQKYDHRSYVDVELAISDLGVGIPKSLSGVHGKVAEKTSHFIELAIDGLSAREGRGGHGLGAMRRIATKSGGNLYIRSETGSILARSGEIVANDDLVFFPGTQIAIKFRGKL